MSNQQQQRKPRRKSMKKSMRRIMQIMIFVLGLVMMYEATTKPTKLNTSNIIDQSSHFNIVKTSIRNRDFITVYAASLSDAMMSETNEVETQITSRPVYLHNLLSNIFYNNTIGMEKILNELHNYNIPEISKYNKFCILESSNYDNEEEQPKVINYDCSIEGYTTSNLNVRKGPSTDSEILGVLPKYTVINFDHYKDEEWVVIEYKGKYAYLYKSYIIEKSYKYIDKDVSGDKRKSYMDWKCITSRSSKQWKLQHNYAYTESNGVRAVNGRYCIALGSYYSHDIGQYVDLILENGTVIPCIIGDAKKNIDTKNNNSIGNDGSAAEFIVNTSSLSQKVRRSGDVSDVNDSWNSNVDTVRIYDINIFD